MIWNIIGVIVLVAIILGTSLHNAFWGIVSFSVFVTIFFIAVSIIKAISLSVKDSLSSSSSAKNNNGVSQKHQDLQRNRYNHGLSIEQKKQYKKETIKDDAIGALVILALFSPLLIGALLAITCRDFTINHPGWTFLIAASPFFTGIMCIFFFGTKGQTMKQRAKSFWRMSWGLIKLFLIVLGVILCLGLIFALLGSIK